ncbi:NAD-dependent protein deacetylase hst4 [Yarrowia sp. C11]|nr:NAD-dependent protein deacetylase hst4 [Yarrowia sp. E02]KAG5365123.1 NAD-dependent protein deacetylase hst4 [Yarrowia sp. C11]
MVSLQKTKNNPATGLTTPPPSFSQADTKPEHLETKHNSHHTLDAQLLALQETILNESDSSFSSVDSAVASMDDFSHAQTPETTFTSDDDVLRDLKTEEKESDSNNDSAEDSANDMPKAKPKSNRRKPLPERDDDAPEVMDITSIGNVDTYSYSALRNSDINRKDLELLHHVFHNSQRLVVITGAGISVHAGIPDFRSDKGLFVSLKDEYNLKTTGKALFDASVFREPATTMHFHSAINGLQKLCQDAKHTPFHHFLNSISEQNRLARLYSQNIDCLDTSLPHLSTSVPLQKPWPTTVQLHGSISKMNCMKCGWMSDLDPELFVGEDMPLCPACVEIEEAREVAGKRPQGIGKLRPRIVLYNEFNPDAESIGELSESDLHSRPDGLVVVGTTLKIPGVKRIVREMAAAVHAMNGGVVWLNRDDPPTLGKPFEGVFDLLVKGDCQLVPKLLQDFETEKDDIKIEAREEKKRKIQEERDAKRREREQEKENRQRAREEEKLQRQRAREQEKEEKQRARAERVAQRRIKTEIKMEMKTVVSTTHMHSPVHSPQSTTQSPDRLLQSPPRFMVNPFPDGHPLHKQQQHNLMQYQQMREQHQQHFMYGNHEMHFHQQVQHHHFSQQHHHMTPQTCNDALPANWGPPPEFWHGGPPPPHMVQFHHMQHQAFVQHHDHGMRQNESFSAAHQQTLPFPVTKREFPHQESFEQNKKKC